MSTRTAPLLAVDGGASKVDAALIARDGTVLATARGRNDRFGPARVGYLENLSRALHDIASRIGVDPDRRPIARLGVFCLAGADLPQDDRRIARWLSKEGWAEEDVLRNDTFAVLRAGTERTWGVAVVCGSGTNCSGLSPEGREYRLPAVGGISGDWGGGMDIGSAALWHAVRAEDGRGERTALARLVPEHFGFRRPRQLMEAIYFGRMREDRVIELPPLVFRAAAEGDRVARSIVDRQADEIVTMAGAAIRRLKMTDLDVDVVLGGGIVRNRFQGFFDRIGDGLARVAPGAEVTVLRAPPVVGAALIGLDRLRAPKAARARVRLGLTHERLADRLTTRSGKERAWQGSSSRA